MENYLSAIQQYLKENASEEALAATKKFVPGSTKVFGIRMPVLNDLAKKYKGGGFTLIKQLWAVGSYEEKMLAAKILSHCAKKDAAQAIELVKFFTPEIDNWAVCDTIGMQSLKAIINTHQTQIFALAKQLNKSKNFWERRLSLVLVEYYTRNKDLHPQIIELIKPLENDEEYYVKKAIVWINKNFKKGK
ncbi:MAG: DNA alkylation repair protein [Ferruginibacter sp.]|nr:DNA alkylation repair protein [Ferruginibacter sp.]